MDDAVSESATFLASFPAIQSAIKIKGSGDGMRFQLDVPENQMSRAIDILAWRQKVLRVTVEPVNVTKTDEGVASSEWQR